jgi:hypothetical protein
MKNVTLLITGTYDLLMHNPAGMKAQNGNALKTGTAIPTPEEEAKASRYVTEDGLLYAPAQGFKTSMFKGSVGRKLGKRGAPSVINGCVFPVEERCILLDAKTLKPIPENRYEVDCRRCGLKSGTQTIGVVRARARVKNWATKLVLEVDDEIILDFKLIEEILNISGRTIGILDYRPQKGGPFGRYQAKLL